MDTTPAALAPDQFQEDLRAAAMACPELVALIGDRFFPGELPDDETPAPWVVYNVPHSAPALELVEDGPTDVLSDVDFHALAESYGAARAIIKAIRRALKHHRGPAVRLCTWSTTAEEETEAGFHHVARFKVQWVDHDG